MFCRRILRRMLRTIRNRWRLLLELPPSPNICRLGHRVQTNQGRLGIRAGHVRHPGDTIQTVRYPGCLNNHLGAHYTQQQTEKKQEKHKAGEDSSGRRRVGEGRRGGWKFLARVGVSGQNRDRLFSSVYVNK